MRKRNGFTIVEILIVLTLLGTLIAITSAKINFSAQQADTIAAELTSALSEIEMSFGLYYSTTGTYPTGLTDATFVPNYLFIPRAATGYDATYGTGGYVLGQQTKQAAPNNGYYIATRVNVTGPNDPRWRSIIAASNKMPATKFFYNTGVAAVTNMAAPAGAELVYITHWITRY